MVARRALAALLLAVALVPGPARGYDPEVHQRLTFLAAKALNRCLEGSSIPPLTPLQVRFIATSNMGLAGSNALVRFFRWSYFDAAEHDRSVAWMMDTRFTSHFEELVRSLAERDDEAGRYRDLGSIVGYVQLVSSPSRALPVYAARFWRWSFSDRFDGYPLDEAALQAAMGDGCEFLANPPPSHRDILHAVAADTLRAVRSPIQGLPTTWQAFWKPARKAGDFGEYGAAGNSFGRRVEFPCTGDRDQTCVLIDDDPLYAEFALQRHLAAVWGSAWAMYLLQSGGAGAPAAEVDDAR